MYFFNIESLRLKVIFLLSLKSCSLDNLIKYSLSSILCIDLRISVSDKNIVLVFHNDEIKLIPVVNKYWSNNKFNKYLSSPLARSMIYFFTFKLVQSVYAIFNSATFSFSCFDKSNFSPGSSAILNSFNSKLSITGGIYCSEGSLFQ